MVRYPVILESDSNDTLLVSFPDFPEAHTFGDTPEAALAHARDALATIIGEYIRMRRPLPRPSPGRPVVELSPMMSMKAELHGTMVAQGITKAELARRLELRTPQVDRLLNLAHQSRLDQLEAAADALNASFDVSLQRRPPALRWRGALHETSGRRRAAAGPKTHKRRV